MKNIYSIIGTIALLTGTIGAQAQKPTSTTTPERNLMLAAPNAGHGTPATLRAGGPPPNDECSSVSAVTLGVGGSITLTGDNTNATDANDWAPGSGLEGAAASVWHKITLTSCSRINLSYCGTTSSFGNVWAFLSPSCPATDADYILFSSGGFVTCLDGIDNAELCWAEVPAGTYYYPVMLDAAATGPYSITVAASPCPTGTATNDDCPAATALTVYDFCNPALAHTRGATESIPAILCNGFTGDAGDDVWFSYVATQTDMTIGVQGVYDLDAVVELLEGTCGSQTSLSCADATFNGEVEQLEQTGATVGTTYYVRVYHYYATLSCDPQFVICVTEGVGVNLSMNELEASDFTVFPNPGTGDFTIQCGQDLGMTTIELIDLGGRTVHSEKANLMNGQQHDVNLAGQLATGAYTLRLITATGRSEQGVMVR